MNTKMPLMDGYEAARVIKKEQNGHITILALTAGVLEEKIDKIRNSGFDGFIAKPFHENDIFDAIGTHLGIQYIQVSEDLDKEPNREAYVAGALKSESLAKLPDRLLANLEEAVSIGSMEMISKIVAKIRGKDPELALTLDRLADEFKYDRILKALRGAQATSEISQSPNRGGR